MTWPLSQACPAAQHASDWAGQVCSCSANLADAEPLPQLLLLVQDQRPMWGWTKGGRAGSSPRLQGGRQMSPGGMPYIPPATPQHTSHGEPAAQLACHARRAGRAEHVRVHAGTAVMTPWRAVMPSHPSDPACWSTCRASLCRLKQMLQAPACAQTRLASLHHLRNQP